MGAGSLVLWSRGLLGLYWLMGFALVAQAEDCIKTVRWSDDPPYGVLAEDGQVRGITIDLAREALARMNCTAKLVEMPWARGLLSLQNGSLDILPGALKTPQREAFAYFSLPVNRSPNVLFVSKSGARHKPIRQLAEVIGSDFRLGAQIGVVYSAEYQALLQRPDFVVHLVFVSNRRAAWSMLAAGRLDGLIADEITGVLELQEMGLSKAIVRSDLVVSDEAAAFALSKKSLNADFARRFDQALQAMFDDGSYQRILQRYLPCEISVVHLGCAPP